MRKSIFATFTAAVAVAAALLLTGCERAIDMTGKPVSFSAVAMDYAAGTRSDLPDTRVVYGDITGTGTKSQAIEWIRGDLITIHSPQCTRIQSDGDKQTCEYIVTEVGSDDASQAGIGLPYYIAEGLQWNGEGAYTFYAMYPGMDTEGMTGNAIVAGEHVTATGTIPQEQGHGTVTGTGNKIVPPDMRNMYMTAKTQVDAAWSNVVLNFLPLSTALEFTITNKFEDTNSAMNVSSISLISDHHALDGGFTVDMDQSGLYGRPNTTLASGLAATGHNKVTLNFSTPVSIAYGKTLTFTFFLNPGNATEVNDLTFVINGTNAGNSETFTRRAKLEDKDGTGVTFPTHQKTRIGGVMVPESIGWEIQGELSVVPWSTGIEKNVTMEEE